MESEAPPAKRSKHDGSSKGGNRAQEPPKPPISKADLRKRVQEEKAKAAALAKEAIKQERAAQRMQAVEEKRLKKEAELLCTGCIAKVAPVLTKLDTTLESHMVSLVPKPILCDARQSQSHLDKMLKVAKANISAERLGDKDRGILCSPDAIVSQAKKNCSAVQDFLKTLAKHR